MKKPMFEEVGVEMPPVEVRKRTPSRGNLGHRSSEFHTFKLDEERYYPAQDGYERSKVGARAFAAGKLSGFKFTTKSPEDGRAGVIVKRIE